MSTDLHNIARQCLELVACAVDGTLTLEEFRMRWPIEADEDRLLWRLMHEAEHYITDEGIRQEDSRYGTYQRSLVESLARDVALKFGGRGHDPE